MPGRRSYHPALQMDADLSRRQRRRQWRDSYYWTAHSAPGQGFVECPRPLAPAIKKMRDGKLLRTTLDHANGAPRPSGEAVAYKHGVLTRVEHLQARRLLSAADAAKHISHAAPPATVSGLWVPSALVARTDFDVASPRLPAANLRVQSGQTAWADFDARFLEELTAAPRRS